MNFEVKPGICALILLLSGLQVFAQATSGNVTGMVYDATGGAITDATMAAKNTATGIEVSTRTKSGGEYRFENLPIGEYVITVSATGFSKAQVNNVNVQLNQTITTNITLAVNQSATTIEVSEAVAAIDTTTAQLATTFETKQLADLPSTASGAGVLNLALLNAGVASSGAVGAGTGPSVAGQRPRNNNFTVEGIDNNSGSVTGPLVSVPNDAVAEFSTLQNQYSPDFGHSSGGQFNLVVKSGSNQFHGMLYEYLQNRNFNAADPLLVVQKNSTLHPRLDDNRFGGNVGGPILRNKLFFFADYEYNPHGASGSAGTLYAPTQAGYNTIAATPNVNQTNLAILKKYLGVAGSPISTATFGAYPVLGTLAQGPQYKPGDFTTANPGTSIEVGQISVASPSFANYENAAAAVDYNASDRDAVRGRFVLNRAGIIDTGGGLPVFFQTRPIRSYLVTASEYHSFSAALVNEFRLGYNRYSSITPATSFTFPGLDQFPNIFINALNTQLGGNGSAPQFTYQNTYQLTNNVTWTKGAHTFKFGFDGIRNISPQAFTQRSRGDYEYKYLNDYLFDFTPDIVAQRSAGNPIYWGNRWLFGFYGNDSWRVRRNLTFNVGLRYEYDTPPAGENAQTLNSLASVPGLIGFPAPKAQTNNLMPRVGIAYTPGTSGKTSIRAGFGINYDVLYDNLGLLTLPPQLSVTQNGVLNGTDFLANGGLRLSAGGTLSAATARARTSGYVQPSETRPKSYQWNFGVEHEFRGNYVFETRYVGTRGTNLVSQSQINVQSEVTAANALPVFWSQPSAAQIASLTNTFSAFSTLSFILPAYSAAGFVNPITSYVPNGNSGYHGWANQLTRRFSNGLQFIGAYTWSHAIDDSTADTNSTSSTPRRPQDSQNLVPERASSALDHRNRISISAVYDLPFFKHSHWFMKNLVGNWEFAPIYTYQTGTLFTVQSSVDSNLNGDAAPDRAIVNPNGGNPAIGSGTSTIKNTGGAVVGYLVTNPLAKYVAAPLGTLATGGRNTEMLPAIDDIDLFASKRFSFRERTSFEISARFFNILNHQQYTGGYLNDVTPNGATTAQRNVFIPTNAIFNRPDQAFSGNPRAITVGAKITF